MRFRITKREVLTSIAIVFTLLAIGFGISSGISDKVNEKNEEYAKALKIDSQEMFEYGLSTNVGNVFTVCDIDTVTPKSISDIDGSHMYIEKV